MNQDDQTATPRGLTPLQYAEAAIDTMRRHFDAASIPPIHHFHYHQGVFLTGVYRTYLLDGNEGYLQYIKDWVDSYVDQDGNISDRKVICLDDHRAGTLLFPLYERTGDARYKKALNQLLDDFRTYPRNPDGGFWHVDTAANQMWLDGLYMAGPLMMQYGATYHQPWFVDEACRQILLMQEKTRISATGLWRHVYDATRSAPWADPQTGLSPEFWGRSIGWVPAAILDELDYLPQSHPERKNIENAVRDLLIAICRHQGPDGRWWQIVDKVGQAGNWPENSCTCLFVYSICKAVKRGILGKSYLEQARLGYQGIIGSLTWGRFEGLDVPDSGQTHGPDGTARVDSTVAQDSDLLIGDVCVGTGPGTYQEYCDRPKCVNDLHGVGTFLLMCSAIQRAYNG